MEGQKGVVVSEVEPASFADDLGFSPGDVIAEVNGQPIYSLDDYGRAIGKLKVGDNVVFKVRRHSYNDRTVTVFLPGVVPADGK
jgi:serine protease Do